MAGIYLDADADSPELDLLLRAADHHVVTTSALGRRRAHDDEQLAYAAENNLILVSFNLRDYLTLQRAWRHWTDRWSLDPKPTHAGILIQRQPPQRAVEDTAHDIDVFLRSGLIIRDRFFKWILGQGWIQDG